MAMSRRSNAGGGQGSKNVVHKPVRIGQQKERIRHAGVAQLGQRQGNHVTEQGATSYGGVQIFGGTGYPSKLGNEVAQNVGAGGSGKGRTIHKTGSQCMTGAPDRGNPMPKAKELWPGWEK